MQITTTMAQRNVRGLAIIAAAMMLAIAALALMGAGRAYAVETDDGVASWAAEFDTLATSQAERADWTAAPSASLSPQFTVRVGDEVIDDNGTGEVSVDLSDGDNAATGANSETDTSGFKKVGKKTYYYDANGKKATGWQTIEGKRYYFSKKGVMQTGLTKIGKKRYFFDPKTGHMAGYGWYKNWAIAYDGTCYKMPKKTSDKTACANKVADLIVKCVGPKKYWKQAGKKWQLYQVRRATNYVWVLAWRCKYTTQGNDYYTPYGVFYAKKYSCAGTAAALKLVLDKMGYKTTHTNKNQWTHQWVKLKMDGKMGWADAFPTGGGADYGVHPVAKGK